MFLSILLFISSVTYAQDVALDTSGKFTILEYRERAPFGGVLFDADATSYLLTMPRYYEEKYHLELAMAVGTVTAEKQLEIDNLNIRLSTLTSQYDTAIQQKDMEILQLQEAVKKNSKTNPWLWGTLGAVVGAGMTVAIVRATAQ